MRPVSGDDAAAVIKSDWRNLSHVPSIPSLSAAEIKMERFMSTQLVILYCSLCTHLGGASSFPLTVFYGTGCRNLSPFAGTSIEIHVL